MQRLLVGAIAYDWQHLSLLLGSELRVFLLGLAHHHRSVAGLSDAHICADLLEARMDGKPLCLCGRRS